MLKFARKRENVARKFASVALKLNFSVPLPNFACLEPTQYTHSFFPSKMSKVEPLLGRVSDSDSLKVSTSLSCANLLLSVLLIALAYLIIKDQPDCDKPLIRWTWVLISLEIATIVMESVRITTGNGAVVFWLGCVIGGAGLLLWGYGHWPVHSSQVCDESLWYFVFIIVTIIDVVVGLVVLLVCGMLVCGVSFADSDK